MDFIIRLADTNIGINSIYDEIHDLCREYLTDGEADISVSISQEDIAREHDYNLYEAELEGIPAFDYADPYLETLAVYRKIAVQLLDRDIFLMHGAVIAVGEKAWLFTAPSGTGKTTHINLWLENIEGSYVINGDKPLIHAGDEFTVYGTPWAGKEGMQKNTSAKLCGIVILERGAENSIKQVPFKEVLPVLIQQCYRPEDTVQLVKALELIRKLGSSLPLYRLECNMLPDAALTAYNALNGG